MESTTRRRSAAVALAAAVALVPGCRDRSSQESASADATAAPADEAPVASATGAGAAPGGASPGGLSRYALTGAPSWQATLPEPLREVSGLAVGAGGRLFAHGDEKATIFEIEAREGRIVKSFELAPNGGSPDLGKKGKGGGVTGDFEDLAIAGDRFFLVTSNGVLLEFAEGEDGAAVPFTAHATGLGDRCEVEGLAHDPGAGVLLLLCKQFHAKPARDRVAVYAWSIAQRRLEPAARVVVPYSSLARVTGAREFNGSALTLAPDGRTLVVIAGPQRVFAMIGVDGKVRGGPLDRATHPQPEGVAFLPDGTMLISSEGAGGDGTIAGYLPR